MLSKHGLKITMTLILLVFLLQACVLFPDNTTSNVTPTSGVTPTSNMSSSSLNTWTTAASGVELRTEHWKSAAGDEDMVTIARFDLQRVHISVSYQPHNPLGLDEWMKQTGALAAINGGYFNENNTSTALIVSDGQSFGTSYPDFGGMLSVDALGNISLRSLSQQPYNSDTEQLQQATQSSPMLMVNGQRTQFSADHSNRRRSVVAMDKQGRLLLIVSPGQSFTLDEMADLLVASDLSLQNALNLDGGSSTGLYVNGQSQKVTIDPYTVLPIVITIK